MWFAALRREVAAVEVNRSPDHPDEMRAWRRKAFLFP
jgi:hypothetical protein